MNNTLANDFTVTNNSLYILVPVIFPSAQIQAMFMESIENNYTIYFHSWCTERKNVIDGNEFQIDIGSAQDVNRPKKLIAAHETHD